MTFNIDPVSHFHSTWSHRQKAYDTIGATKATTTKKNNRLNKETKPTVDDGYASRMFVVPFHPVDTQHDAWLFVRPSRLATVSPFADNEIKCHRRQPKKYLIESIDCISCLSMTCPVSRRTAFLLRRRRPSCLLRSRTVLCR